MASPLILSLTNLLKRCNTSGDGIDILAHLHLTNSNSTSKQTAANSVEEFYQTSLITIKGERDANEDGMESPDNFFVLMIDNYNKQTYAQESMISGKPFTRSIDTMSTLVKAFRKPAEMKRQKGRAPINTDMNADVRRLAFEAVMRGTLDFKDILVERDADGIMLVDGNGKQNMCINTNGQAHLSGFDSLGCLPFKSSLDQTCIQAVIGMISHGFFGANENEIALPADPEFTLQFLGFTQSLYSDIKFISFFPPPFHLQKHSLESVDRCVPWQLLIQIQFLAWLGFKKSVFPKLSNEICTGLTKDCIDDEITIDGYVSLLDEELAGHASEVEADDEDEEVEEEEEVEGDTEEDSLTDKILDDELVQLLDNVPEVTTNFDTPDLELIALAIARKGIVLRTTNTKARNKLKAKDTALIKNGRTSYKRSKYNNESLYYAYLAVKAKADAIIPINSLTQMIGSFFKDVLSLSVDPFQDFVVEGTVIAITSFFSYTYCTHRRC